MSVVREPLLSRLRHAAREKIAMDPSLARALLVGSGAVGAGVPIALAMRAHENSAREHASNVGFGAGVATGLAGPRILRGIAGLAQPQAPSQPGQLQ